MRTKLKIKILREGAKIPQYATDGSAGMDLSSGADGAILIPAGGVAKVPTDISAECDRRDGVLLIFARSGLATKHGIFLANSVGVVDPDYRGEIIVSLRNGSDADYTVMPGERIAQLVIVPFLTADVEVADELSETERGAGGFGSTGRS